ncbi:NAD+ synthase [Kamptonema animale CS-326]|jgi:NAD+ synthase (glutamine-hydrolysing)|uniref:NAD+ synthase n=1 Tax=Kamptonema animale TaxID=92934 RepID=UPI00232CF179|nr:NAD+ synthase [Kamptonema animale]MDB9510223.1 NAD+ synthase [Kamptonema animale CS-326]
MKIAIAQLNPTVGDLTGNSKLILEAAKKAAEADASLLLTPELCLVGYPPRDLLINPGFIEAAGQELQQLAQNLPQNLIVLVGTVIPNPHAGKHGGKPLFNSVALLENGEVKRIFNKRLLPTYDVFDEDRYFEPGEQSEYFTIGKHKIGVTICEDLWNNEEFWGKRSYAGDPFSDLAKMGADLVVNLSASPYSVGKRKLREAMLRHSVTRYEKPIIYANQIGGNDDLIFDGSSFALNRLGEVVCSLTAFESDFVLLEYDETQRDLLPNLIKPVPESSDGEIWEALVLGVRDYVRKCGFSKVVLGLSGGIDSALVAAIATFALGAENVLGVLMPSPYSSDHSVKDAEELGKNLGITTEIIPIGELMKVYDKTLENLFAGTTFGLAEENIQSRIRGNLLMAISNKFGHLLLSTGNKSEMAVGYCTLYGDMNGGLAVIADVPKTRVYSLCQWLNSGELGTTLLPLLRGGRGGEITNYPKEIIPVNILSKPPSAELKPGQVDRDSLPPYDILDDILHRLVEKHESAQQIIAAGHDEIVVKRVVQLVMRAEFKRRQAPPGLKISDRAFGTGWRMPIAKTWVQ